MPASRETSREQVKGWCAVQTRARRACATFVALAVLAIAIDARAQTIRNTGPSSSSVQLGFNGIVSTSVQLTIVGSGPTTLTGATSAVSPTPALATVNFGTFSALNPTRASNADAYRVTSGTPGAVIAARLIATLVYNGSATGSITIARKSPAGAAPDVPLANLRIASPRLASWTSGTQGVQVPNAGLPGFNICTATGSPTCVNNTAYEHQLAVFVPDSQPTGTFTTVVLYTGVSP